MVLARATKERPEAVRLTMKMLDEITAPPWKPMTILTDAHPQDLRTPDGEAEGNPEVHEVPEHAPYRMQLRKTTLEKVGYSPNCPKCSGMRAGDKKRTKSHSHTEECRIRVTEAMKKDATLRKMVEDEEERENEWLAKQLEKDDAERKRNEYTTDYWKIDGDDVIRVHVQPRRVLFVPYQRGCPDSWNAWVEDLGENRSTRVKFVHNSIEEMIIDNWTMEEAAERELQADWTGETTFRRIEQPS